MELHEIREEIRQIDEEMAELFVRRMEAVRKVAACKNQRGLPVLDREQESRVIQGRSARIKDPELRKKETRSLLAHEKVGICLGSQISQVMALLVPTDFDHFIKDKLGLKFYVRHMDDGVILLNDKAELARIRDMLKEEAAKYGLTLQPKKTKIVKLTKGFTFLKVKYRISNGKTIKTLVRSGIVRMRRKLKKLSGLVGKTKVTKDDVYASVQSWAAHARTARSYHAVRNMMKLYEELFGCYRIT